MKLAEPVDYRLYKEPTMPDDDVNEKEQKTTSQTQTQTYVGEEKMQLENPELVDGTDKIKKREMQLETSELVDDDFNNKKKQKMQQELLDKQQELFDKYFPESEPSYIGAAFRLQCVNEVFMFIGYEYLVIKYDPCTRGSDEIVKGPFPIGKGFPTLYSFQSCGVSAAFSCLGTNHAYLFEGSLCAKVGYDIETKKTQVLKVNATSRIFPALKGTIFKDNIDAAFESTEHEKVYLFSGKEYCLFDYINGKIIVKGPIEVGFPCLKDTVFESGIGAAFASHNPNEAFLFKDNIFLRLKFSPGETNSSYIIEGPLDILPSNWPSLKDIMPYYMDFDPEDLLTSEGEDTATSEGEDTADSKGEVKASLEDVNDIASSEDVNNTASEDDKKVNRIFGYDLHQILTSGEMSKGFEKPVDWHEELMLSDDDDDDDDVNEKEQKSTPHTQTYVGEEKMQLGQPELVDVIDENKTQEMQLETSELVEDEVPTALKVEEGAASMGGDKSDNVFFRGCRQIFFGGC